ncbi:MAG: hypothetical protein FGM15_01350 [Chthoniobacterales bacterium]|nr:hypothetical protein [Chthoniobacterales bacterium]
MRPAGKWILVAAAIVLFGLARLPFERSLDRLQRMSGLRSGIPEISLREQIGQLSYAAALGGFRSLVAAFLWIDAHTAWEQTAWGRMAGIFQSVTALQPRSLVYWDLSSWHMAWNAAIAARENPREPSELLRIRAEREYKRLGRDFLERGIANNPDSYLLHERLGVMLRDKFSDHAGAAAAFDRAAQMDGAPAYVKRMAAYELAQVPGREKEAYDRLRAIYDLGESERLPRVITLLGELETKLGVPQHQRIQDPAPAD